MNRLFFVLAILVAVAGCITLPSASFSGSGLSIVVTTASNEVFAGRETTVFVDVTNTNKKIVNDVVVEFLVVGIFTIVDPSSCTKHVDRMLPDQIVTLACRMTADEHVLQKQETQTIHVRAAFKDVLVAQQTFDIVSEDYYQIEQASGRFTHAPNTYSYHDNNVQLDVEFSDTLPLIVREENPSRDRGTFVHFTIRNIGDGLISSIAYDENFRVFNSQQTIQLEPLRFDDISRFFDDFVSSDVVWQSDDVVDCEPFGTLQPIGREFPRITCVLTLPQDRDFVIGYEITPVVYYTYEIRGSATVEVMR